MLTIIESLTKREVYREKSSILSVSGSVCGHKYQRNVNKKPAVASYPAVLLLQGQNNNSNIFILNPDIGGDYPYTQRYRGINRQMEDMVRKTKAYWIAALRKNCNITRQKLGFFCYFAIFLQSYCT